MEVLPGRLLRAVRETDVSQQRKKREEEKGGCLGYLRIGEEEMVPLGRGEDAGCRLEES